MEHCIYVMIWRIPQSDLIPRFLIYRHSVQDDTKLSDTGSTVTPYDSSVHDHHQGFVTASEGPAAAAAVKKHTLSVDTTHSSQGNH